MRIRKLSAQRDLPGIGIHLGFRKQQLAGNRIDRSVVEHEADLGGIRRNPVEIAAVKRAAQLVHLRDRLGEVGVDRVELLDGSEAGGVVLDHQRAFAHQRSADDAADRRTDRRVIEIEFCTRDFGLAAADFGLGLTLRRDRLFVLHFRGRALAGQCRDTPRMLGGEIKRSHCLVQRGLARLQFHLERLGVDPVQRIASFHLGALLEQALDDDARNPRPNFRNPGGRDPARQFTHEGAGLGPYGKGAYLRLGGFCRGGRRDRLIAASQKRRHRSQHQNDACRSRS